VTQWIGRVRVMPREGLLDPQGHAVEHALGSLGFNGVARVRVGRTFEIALEAATDRDGARRAYREIVDTSQDPELVRWARGRLAGLESPPPRDAPKPKPKPKPKSP